MLSASPSRRLLPQMLLRRLPSPCWAADSDCRRSLCAVEGKKNPECWEKVGLKVLWGRRVRLFSGLSPPLRACRPRRPTDAALGPWSMPLQLDVLSISVPSRPLWDRRPWDTQAKLSGLHNGADANCSGYRAGLRHAGSHRSATQRLGRVPPSGNKSSRAPLIGDTG